MLSKIYYFSEKGRQIIDFVRSDSASLKRERNGGREDERKLRVIRNEEMGKRRRRITREVGRSTSMNSRGTLDLDSALM